MVLEEILDNGLIMRNVRTEEDRRKFVQFNAVFNNASEGATCDILLHEHKAMSNEDFFLIEDAATGDFLAAICLIPWEISFEGVCIRAAMLEMVLSHPQYRKLGLIRKLILHFQSEVEKRGYDISIITGIPYYYRQYGYSYGLDYGCAEVLPVSCVHSDVPAESGNHKLRSAVSKETAETAGQYRLRCAVSMDIADLDRLYLENAAGKNVFIRRSREYWEYLIEKAGFDVRLLVNTERDTIDGYFMVRENCEEQRIDISESAFVDEKACLAGLTCLKSKPLKAFWIISYDKDMLTSLARKSGSRRVRGTQWLLKTKDHAWFLNQLKPVLEKRLAAAGFESITKDVTVNFFRYAIKMYIYNGKISSIEPVGFLDSSMGADGGDLCIPNDAFVRLLFGYRNLEELWDAWPDIVVKEESRQVLEALFPPLAVFLHTPYHFQG
jgi:GNAT superfamily N-acetyltransferase